MYLKSIATSHFSVFFQYSHFSPWFSSNEPTYKCESEHRLAVVCTCGDMQWNVCYRNTIFCTLPAYSLTIRCHCKIFRMFTMIDNKRFALCFRSHETKRILYYPIYCQNLCFTFRKLSVLCLYLGLTDGAVKLSSQINSTNFPMWWLSMYNEIIWCSVATNYVHFGIASGNMRETQISYHL